MPKITRGIIALSILVLLFSIGFYTFFFNFANKGNYKVDASPALIAAPSFTGNAITDFSTLPGVYHFTDGAGDVGIDPGMIPQRTGWDMRDVYAYYDINADKMYIGVHCNFICGDVEGDGNPAAPSAQWLGICGGAICDSDWGTGEIFGVYLNMNNTGNYDVAVGKPRGGLGIGTWRIQHTSIANAGLGGGSTAWNLATVGTFGTGLIANTTAVISTNHDMEFSISNFSTMPGFTGGPIGIGAFAGSITDAGNGEDNTDSPAPFTLPAAISGHVHEDTNNDNVGDVCINGTTIQLYDSTGTTLLQTTTTQASVTIPAGETCYYEFLPVQPGTYVIKEVQPTGFVNVSTTAGTTTVSNVTGVAGVDVITTTVVSTDISPNNNFVEEKPFLTVTKVVVNDNGGTSVVANFPLAVGGTSVTSGVQNQFSAGTYAVTETNVTGYASTFSGDCDASGNVTLDNSRSPANAWACTITNNDIPSHLSAIKVVVNDNGGTIPNTGFVLKDNGTTVTTGVSNIVNPGSHTVSETLQPGYTQVSIVCVDDTSGASVANPVILAQGQSVTCTITNDDNAPTLTVNKVVVNDNGGNKVAANFPLFVNGVAVTSGTVNNETAGVAYTVSETPQAGYTQTSITCTDNATAAVLTNPVTLALDQDVTCVVTNDDIAPTLKVTKVVVNDNGGTKVISDFPLLVNATSVTSGTVNTELANTALTISETLQTGYAQTSITCTDNANAAVLANPVTLAPAQNVSCVVTNDDVQPLLTVTKIVTNNNGGTKVVSDFPLKVGATTVTSGTQSGYNAGTYAITETGSVDYLATYSGDCNASGSITLSVGDVKTCTITNNDYPNLGDYVWTDTNANGIQEGTETGINGVTVNLYCSGTAVVLKTTTTANNPVGGLPGYYQFQHLNPATCNYQVEFVKPIGTNITVKDTASTTDLLDSDADPTTGKTVAITMVMDQDQEFWDAGIYTPVKLGDYVWTDTNGDGIQDATETDTVCRTGAVVALTTSAGAAVTDASGVAVANQTTTSSGAYLFTNLVPGTYKVTFTAPVGSGCVFTTKDTATTTDLLDSDADRTTGATTTITLVSGVDQLTWDAGLFIPLKIGDYVWTDKNADGIQDATETDTVCRTGAVVALTTSAGGAVTNASGVAVTNQTTTNTGAYLFTNLAPGTYKVTFTAPAGSGCVFTNKDTATTTDLLDSDADRTTGSTITITAVSGVDQLTWDAGLYIPAKLGDYVWQDANANGIQEVSETLTTCRTGVVVSLTNAAGVAVTDASGVAVANQTTTSTGAYLFTNLIPGSYIVKFTAPAASGCIFTNKDTATTTDLLDSDADTVTGKTITITLVSGDNQTQWDAGLWIPACIGNYLWLDLNLDGKQDATEKGVAGIAVSLNLPDGTTSQQVTDANGKYLFCDLPAGNYTVQFPTGLLYTTKDTGADDTIDSDVDTVTGITPTINLLNGVDQLQWDAGLILQKIGDYVWKDSNADGIQDATEKGINGITVTLTDCNGLELSTTTTAKNTVTNVDGYYEFYIDPGTYCVKITKPTDLVRTKQDKGTDDTLDSDIDKNYTTAPIILKAAVNQPQWDAGLVEPACIGDRIYEDLNANGLEDAGEPGIPNAVVTLLMPDGTKVDKTADATGTYFFCELTPDTYTVSIDLTQPALVNFPDFGFGYEKTSPQTVTKTLNPLDYYKLADFGYLPYAKLGDRVFIDKNKNCIFDSDDKGVEGIKLNLFDSAGNLLKSTTTDSTGTYSFTVAANLVYRVDVDESWKVNATVKGDSDTCGLTKTSPKMTPNQNYVDLDFGFVPPPVANTGADMYLLLGIGGMMIVIGFGIKRKYLV